MKHNIRKSLGFVTASLLLVFTGSRVSASTLTCYSDLIEDPYVGAPSIILEPKDGHVVFKQLDTDGDPEVLLDPVVVDFYSAGWPYIIEDKDRDGYLDHFEFFTTLEDLPISKEGGGVTMLKVQGEQPRLATALNSLSFLWRERTSTDWVTKVGSGKAAELYYQFAWVQLYKGAVEDRQDDNGGPYYGVVSDGILCKKTEFERFQRDLQKSGLLRKL